jgi:hypothetical protein
VLAIGVERDHCVGPLAERIVDAGLQRCALTEVERMPENRSAGRKCTVGGVVVRAVVHDHDPIAGARDLGDNARDHLRLVVGGNHHEHLCRRHEFHRRFFQFK